MQSLLFPNQKFKRSQKSGLLWRPCMNCLLTEGLDVYEKKWKNERWHVHVYWVYVDKQLMTLDGLALLVEACNQYVYLGIPFTADRVTTTAIKVESTRQQ
ncbi:hypothetical protein E2C01_073531 [Portunus trituberculatus]|uniref:Uncharacterized protein n=1 Tax=Portunus trituberculatus TaxID=210409 RepID=A0A5B7I3A0_PORTR|nr:hypothetical protein [Portunus trituberculatus]